MLIAFRYGDDRPLARLIVWWQRSDASHCEAIIRATAVGWLCVSSSWLGDGVRVKDMPLPADRWRIYYVPGGSLPDAWAAEHAGEGYDWLAVVGIYLRPTTRGSRRRWYCAEVCAELLGLVESWRWDVASLEAVCRRFGVRLQ